ncbi:hypothetical protein PsorP6_014950 [Peronosclerospora sorghi]|uniref:Uncharacterized protein n=1 Tax=Peronosclerospora sorghi TaxID=230839 RepID=A0ACC0VRA1_9STRA|nr:hypothetical protein PsorP6_014950 [Peronosclerospora sorghi]
MSDMRLFIYRNEAGSEGKVMNLRSKDSITRLKKMASKKLVLRAKRLFLASGAESSDVDELQNNDTLYISQGEAFYKLLGPDNGQETFQMSVLESGGVGKSALTLSSLRDYFVKDWDPCMLEILDTAGKDDFESLRGQWMMDKDGYVFVYSMNSRISLHSPPTPAVANKKAVVEREPNKCQVSTEEGRRIAHSYNARYIETSAFTGANVTAVYETFVREVRRKKVPKPKKSACFLL